MLLRFKVRNGFMDGALIGTASQHLHNLGIVQAIRGRHKKWVPLLDGIRDCAAGLILCSSAGCRLNLEQGRQVIIFDPTVI